MYVCVWGGGVLSVAEREREGDRKIGQIRGREKEKREIHQRE